MLSPSQSSGPGAGRRRGERGAVSMEAALVLTVVMVLIVMVIAAGRVAMGKISVDTAAQAGARAASLARSPGEARSAAAAAATATLDDRNVACQPQVSTDTSGFAAPVGQPGTVSTTVVCVVDLGDLALPGLGSRTYTATSTSVLDRYRAR